MMRRTPFFLFGILLLHLVGCRTGGPAIPSGDWWDLAAVEIVEWSADDPAFEQRMALEGSGLTVHGDTLYAVSEKYARLLRINTESHHVEVFRLGVPKYSELEGITLAGDEALMCDEAHAAVYSVELAALDPDGITEAQNLPIVDIEVEGGKEGLEGLTAVEDDPDKFYLLLERSGEEAVGCRSTIYPLRRHQGEMIADGEPLLIELEDCNWRLTGLFWWRDHLLGLKTRYPGEQLYEVVVVDQTSGELTTVLEMSELLVGMPALGWTNNVEGIAVDHEGALWLLGDNAMTGTIDDPEPPPAKRKTLLMKIPPTRSAPR